MPAGRSTTTRPSYLSYGLSQFLSILSALFFVISADAYPARPRMRRGYIVSLVGVLMWFTLAPLALDTRAVFAPGHVLVAGTLAVAGVAHLMLLRQARLLGAAVVGVSLLLIAAAHVWIVLFVDTPSSTAVVSALVFMQVLYLITALGMQLMTFEDMTWELRRTNRRLEAAQGKLRRMVITDPLTGCRNRRFFDEIIGREIQRHRRYSIPMSLLFVDIDRFKSINDTLGHDAGDRVLREVAAFLLSHIREADYVFRWGGDEFLVLLSCGEDEAGRRGASLQSEFSRYAAAASLPPGVGLSIGCAEIDDKAENIMTLIKRADERMYENKRLLRGRASVSSSSVPPAPAAAGLKPAPYVRRLARTPAIDPARVARSFSSAIPRPATNPEPRAPRSEPTSGTASSTRRRPSPTRRARQAASSARSAHAARSVPAGRG